MTVVVVVLVLHSGDDTGGGGSGHREHITDHYFTISLGAAEGV